ncbi:MAG: carbon-nitrogen hydrolase family protein [Gammaproteobacteria bacterium]
MQNLVAAVVQMVSGRDPAANLADAARLVGEAAKQGAKLVVLPENFAVFSPADVGALAEAAGDASAPFQSFLSRQAAQHGIWLVGGSIPVRPVRDDSDPRVFSSCLVYNPDGELVARYDKLHLFDVDIADAQGRYRESERFRHGDSVVVFDTPYGRVGIAICYDLRFPELFHALSERGAEIIVLPSAFTRLTGQAHWDVLVRARAIENTCFLLAAGQGGRHDSRRETFGHSMIVDPWGMVLAALDEGEGVAVATLDARTLANVRTRLPSIRHRRLRVAPAVQRAPVANEKFPEPGKE